MTDRRLTAGVALAALVLLSLAGVGPAHAGFSVQAAGAAQSAATASLTAVTGAQAQRDASGTATVGWTVPALRPDVAPGYTVQRSIAGATATAINPAITTTGAAAGFDDDLTVPATIQGAPVTAISAGTDLTCAVAGAKAYCWGRGNIGQLGNGTSGSGVISGTPVLVTGLLSNKVVTDISVGSEHACAIAEGKAYCWGSGGTGRLGNGDVMHQASPVAVDASGVLANKTVTAIAAGSSHTCAIADGQAYCWGSGAFGQLGDGAKAHSSGPVAVSASGVLEGTTLSAISAGPTYTCVIADGAVHCWGVARIEGLSEVVDSVPTALDASAWDGEPVVAISLGSGDRCAVAGGAVYCWSASSGAAPAPVNIGDATVIGVAVGVGHVCAFGAENGELYCWGYGGRGQLGNGSTPSTSAPVAVTTSGALNGKSVSALAAGHSSSCAVADGAAYCWGWNSAGQLGNGSTQGLRAQPVAVTGLLAHATCSLDWLLTSTERCAPGENVSVQYTIDYTKAGWSPAAPSAVTANWGS